MGVYETCAVILNALNNPTKGLADTSEKQKNKLYGISLRMKLFRLTQALDGYRPESTTSIRQDAQSVVQSIAWIANSLGSLLGTDQSNELDQPHDSDYYSSQGMMLAV